jgi:hypothetical protein
MPKLTTRNVMIGFGVLIILVSALADTLGLGREPGFGWKQGIGVAVGLGLVVGSALWRRASR